MRETEKRKGLRHSLILGAMVLAALLITMPMLGCDDDDDKHTHVYEDMKHDDNNHWKRCAFCSSTEAAKAHVYDGKSDTTCNVCGYVRADHEHVWDEWSTNNEEHWRKCRDCDATKDYGPHKSNGEWTQYDATIHARSCVCGHYTFSFHVYDNDSDTSCNVCGYIRPSILNHDHTWSEKWTYNSEAHWRKCTKCSAIKDSSFHSYKWKSNADVHWQECLCGRKKASATNHVYDDASDAACNTCGHVRYIYIPTPTPHEHTWSEDWSRDENHHWHQCVSDDTIDPASKAEHSYGTEWYSNDQKHWHQCVCGAKQAAVEHDSENYVYDDDKDPGYHWKVCDTCGKIFARGPHSYNVSSCTICGSSALFPTE